MTTLEKITELQKLKRKLALGGGKDKQDKQHAAGKLTAQERIALLMDEGSFIEIGALAGSENGRAVPEEGVVCGYGSVDGRLTFVYAQDYTALGGAMSKVQADKICNTIDMAVKMGAPVVAMFDSCGARVDEGIEILGAYGRIFNAIGKASGVVPQIALVMGTCAGSAMMAAQMQDFVVMTEKSHMFVNSTQIVAGYMGSVITDDELGGAKVHSEKSGLAQFAYENDEAAIAGVKSLLSFMPSNNLEDAPETLCDEADINRVSSALMTVIPDDVDADYDVKSVVAEITDAGSFVESGKDYGKNIVTGFARMGGKSVGIVANNAGRTLCGGCADKAASFVNFCDSFNIPLVTLVDADSFVVGKDAEHSKMAKAASKLICAFSQATMPKVTVVLRKAYGPAALAMCSKATGADIVFAWPTAEISVMNPDGAACVMFAEQITTKQSRQAKADEYRKTYASPYEAARLGYADDIIEPDSTRPRVISALDMLYSKRDVRPAKKHTNV